MAEQAHAAPDAQPDQPKSPSAGSSPSGGLSSRIGMTRGQLIAVLAVVLAVNLPFIHYLLRGEAPVTAQVPFSDDFNRDAIGSNYFTTGGHWRIHDGWVHSPGVKNNPLWLKARLPADVAVEFDVKSEAADGDIKAEIFGNGRDHASGYVVIFGGWSNTISVIARLDEHGHDRKESRAFKVEKGHVYHMRIERKGNTLRWLADNQLMMEYADPNPLRGSGHDRFGFSSWDSDLYFDNLTIQPL